MKNGKFWNKAFLAALSRVPAEQAKIEADKAVKIASTHLQDEDKKGVTSKILRWKDQKIPSRPRS